MTSALVASCGKELRALLLPWTACAAALVAAGVLGGVAAPLAVGILWLGAVLIGAWSIGHEFSGRTLSLWLTQPVSRRSAFLTKWAVLTFMLLALTALAGVVLRRDPSAATMRFFGEDRLAVVALPLLIGVVLAPCFTLVCRSPLAGSVFTIAVLAAAWGSGTALSAFGYGPPAGPSVVFANFRAMILGRAILTVTPFAAIATWMMFARLEAIDGIERHLTLPMWPAGSGAPRSVGGRSPLWQLARKEFHVQQMTVVVAALYLVAWAANAFVTRQIEETWLVPTGAYTVLYCMFIGLLAGSLASAEERQYGTLEWQVLQPVAVRQQWGIKAGIALAMTAVFGLGLPIALALVDRSTNDLSFPPTFVGAVFGACVVGLYVSSFTTSGVRALLVSVLLVSVMGLAIAVVTQALTAIVSGPVDPVRVNYLVWRSLQEDGSTLTWLMWIRPTMLALLIVAFVALMWRLALGNYRAAERTTGVLPRQAVWLAASLLLATGLFTVVDGVVNRIVVSELSERIDRRLLDAPRPARPATD